MNAEAQQLLADLEKYPHIVKKIELMWGHRECREYLYSLGLSDRLNRQGFEFSALIAIARLLEIHDQEHPAFAPGNDPWHVGNVFDRGDD